MSDLILGDTSQFGIERPKIGPLELKNLYGKTPVLDVGTVAQIKTGKIKVTFSLHTNQIQKGFSSYYVFLSFFFFFERIMFSCLNQQKKIYKINVFWSAVTKVYFKWIDYIKSEFNIKWFMFI